jgi:hypothetical protein
MSAVIDFAAAGVMSETVYEAKRDALRATYGDTATDRLARFEQGLAQLFVESGWTQDQLALKEGKSQSWVKERVRFGRFLDFSANALLPKNLTEGRFRKYWEQTPAEAKEEKRFHQVQQAIAEDVSLQGDRSKNKNKDLAKAILERFGDGHWHWESTIVAQTGGSPEAVASVLFQMFNSGTYHTHCERKKGGKDGWKYRIVVGVGRKIDVSIVVKELSPFIKELEAEGRKPQLLLSSGVPAMMAVKLKEILEKLTHTALSISSRKRSEPNE